MMILIQRGHTGSSALQADRLPIVTIVPDFCARMYGVTAKVSLTVPMTFSSMMRWIVELLWNIRISISR